MLKELRVRNLAVIEDAKITLAPGLNVLTGETGAGKSMLIDALSLLLGERASTDLIRGGAERAVVEAEFEGVGFAVGDFCSETGVELDDGRLVVRREINAQGRNRAWAGGGPATLSVLTGAGERLVDLHGQHESQSLVRPSVQRDILDAFADGGEAANLVRVAHAKLREAEAREEELRENVDDVRKRLDYLKHVAEEISGAKPVEGEEDELEVEARRLANVETITRLSNAIVEALQGEESSADQFLAVAARALDDLARIDETVAGWKESLESAIAEVADVALAAEDYLSSVESDPERLEHVEARRDILFRLKQKYGPTLADVIETGATAARELESADTADMDLSSLAAERKRLAAELESAATRLTEVRRNTAGVLGDQVSVLITRLGLPDGEFSVELAPLSRPGSHGAEDVSFTVRLNRGLPARPLAKVASGGELSRIMLALKVVLAEQDSIPTLIFDEVDQGIGGEVVNSVARALSSAGRARQVLVITHLPQIAAIADHHFVVEKDPAAGIARATVAEIDGEDRVAEIARMLGDPRDAVLQEHAAELMNRRLRAS